MLSSTLRFHSHGLERDPGDEGYGRQHPYERAAPRQARPPSPLSSPGRGRVPVGLQSDIFLPLCLRQGGGLEALTERFQPQQATPPLMMEQKPGMYPQPYSSASPTTNLPGAFPGMVRQKPSFGPMPVQVPPPRGAFPTNMAMQPRQTLNRPPTAPNQLRLQLQQRLQGQQQVILPPPHPRAAGRGTERPSVLPAAPRIPVGRDRTGGKLLHRIFEGLPGFFFLPSS